jgi:hypothetical protein
LPEHTYGVGPLIDPGIGGTNVEPDTVSVDDAVTAEYSLQRLAHRARRRARGEALQLSVK